MAATRHRGLPHLYGGWRGPPDRSGWFSQWSTPLIRPTRATVLEDVGVRILNLSRSYALRGDVEAPRRGENQPCVFYQPMQLARGVHAPTSKFRTHGAHRICKGYHCR